MDDWRVLENATSSIYEYFVIEIIINSDIGFAHASSIRLYVNMDGMDESVVIPRGI